METHKLSSHILFARVFALLLTLVAIAAEAQERRISGSVRDASGSAIAGATITLRSQHSEKTIASDADGAFSFSEVPDTRGTIEVAAPGFELARKEWLANDGGADEFVITLRPAGARESIVVSASRSDLQLSEVPGGAVLLSAADLAANPALTLDDLLRQVPGFSLFRRSSSRAANPTTQGVSLRGVGASGPSRALVLEDGVPMVDPFGGWVYWDRIPRAELASVEVVRGGASDLYGSGALGGVVQFLTRAAKAPSASLDISYGSENTPNLSTWAGAAFSHWDFGVGVDMERSDGFILIPTSHRGAVDTPSNSKHGTVDAAAGYRLSQRGRAFVRGTLFDESRNNGTPIQKNSTGTGFGAAGINAGLGESDWIEARVYGQAQGYDQTFSSIAVDRNSERLTDIQHVPSQSLGGSAQWNHVVRSHTLIGGVDSLEVIGASDERLFSTTSGKQFATNMAGGRQRSTGIFGEDVFRIHNAWTIIAGVRWDDWRNFRGRNFRFPSVPGPITAQIFPARSEDSFSPRLAIMRALNSNLSISASGYRAFRAPTLNELYRSFRQGASLTQANAQLRAERLTGAEAGIRVAGFQNRLETRGTVFWSDIVNPVTNVTISITPPPPAPPTLITRQRQNLGRTRSLGFELDGRIHVASNFDFSSGYQYTHATVVTSSPALVGLNVPEVPRHQVTWEARYWNPERLLFSIDGRYSSSQYDDDLNTLFLERYYVIGVMLGREFAPGLTGYAAIENVTNNRYPVAIVTPVSNLGPPVLARIGVRYDFPRR
jgi:outer membrane receptor protein involved in Fe transport